MIFDEATLRKLQALTLTANRVRAGRMRGDRRSSRRGSSIEFADFRDYTPGDDLRRLDWNIYARLDRPFITLFEDEEDLAVYIFLDGSKSMDWGSGDAGKFTFARRLAAGLGAITLHGGDALRAALLSGGSESASFGPARGGQRAVPFFAWLEGLAPSGTTALNDALLQFSITGRRPGLLFLVTDLLDPAGWQDGVRRLAGRGHQIVLLHLLAPDELNPELAGDLKLVDIESESTQDVSLDPVILAAYRRQLERWLGEVRGFCRSRGIHHVQTSTAVSWEQFLLRDLRREGIVK